VRVVHAGRRASERDVPARLSGVLGWTSQFQRRTSSGSSRRSRE
jgi:hypothetical protein